MPFREMPLPFEAVSKILLDAEFVDYQYGFLSSMLKSFLFLNSRVRGAQKQNSEF